VPRVVWQTLPPLRGGIFWQFYSEVVLFDNLLGQVVLYVKISGFRGPIGALVPHGRYNLRALVASQFRQGTKVWKSPLISRNAVGRGTVMMGSWYSNSFWKIGR
jgi:hypothetical protein